MTTLNIRKLLAISVMASITAFLLILLFTKEKFIAIEKINPIFLALATIAHISAWLFWSLRLKIMSEFTSKKRGLRLLEALKITLASFFAASITPSHFGGEPMTVYLLNKRGFTIGEGTAVVIGGRVLDFCIIILFATMSIFMFRSIVQNTILYSIFTCMGVILLGIIILMGYGFAKPKSMKKVIDSFLSYKLMKRIKDKVYREMSDFYYSLKKFKHEGRKILLSSMFLTIAFWLADFSIPPLILLGFGRSPIWAYSIAAQSILVLIVTLPTTPGSSGVAEVSFASLFSPVTGTSILGLLTIVWRLVTYYMNMIAGGLVSLAYICEGNYIKGVVGLEFDG
ncbi:MAG: lysylphosphatidylglycerol synthase transmembrane domain-containing protein [Candidatus Methanospirareceae archaeon]